MRFLFGLAFAILIALEFSLLAIVIGVIGMFFPLLWARSPMKAAVAAILLTAGAVALWKSWRRPDTTQPPTLHPGISISHIPISGAVGCRRSPGSVVFLLAGEGRVIIRAEGASVVRL